MKLANCIPIFSHSGLFVECHFESLLVALEKIMVKRALLGVASRSRYYWDLLEQNIQEVPLSVDPKQHMTNFCFFIPALMLTIFVPLKLRQLFSPVEVAATRNTEEAVFLPAAIFHVVIPFIIERVQYCTVVKVAIETFMKFMCQSLDLNDLLLDAQKEGE